MQGTNTMMAQHVGRHALVWGLVPLLMACGSSPATVSLSAVQAPIAEADAWQRLATAHVDTQVWQSVLGNVTVQRGAPAQWLGLVPVMQAWDSSTRAQINADGHTLIAASAPEVASLADLDFWLHTYHVRQPDRSRLRLEHWLGVVDGHTLQISVRIDDNVDARSYAVLQALLVRVVQQANVAQRSPHQL